MNAWLAQIMNFSATAVEKKTSPSTRRTPAFKSPGITYAHTISPCKKGISLILPILLFAKIFLLRPKWLYSTALLIGGGQIHIIGSENSCCKLKNG